MDSASKLLLKKTYTKVWHRGEEYAQSGRVNILKKSEREIEAEALGKERYAVSLKFTGGGLSKKCNCPYANGSKAHHAACKHMVAVVLLWDKERGISPPTQEEVDTSTIPPPEVSRDHIRKIYDNPLGADLDLLRNTAEKTGSWSRPHSRLPKMPSFSSYENLPLSLEEIKLAFQEMRRWVRRPAYDPYFCAGEMVAAFCEVMRIVKRRIAATPPSVSAEILREAQKFHYAIVQNLIDSSDGLHVFTEAYLNDIYQELKNRNVPDSERSVFEERLGEFESHKDDY